MVLSQRSSILPRLVHRLSTPNRSLWIDTLGLLSNPFGCLTGVTHVDNSALSGDTPASTPTRALHSRTMRGETMFIGHVAKNDYASASLFLRSQIYGDKYRDW